MKNTGEIKIPILNNEFKVIVVFGDSNKVSKVLKKHGYEDIKADYGTDRGLTYHDPDCHPVIAMPKFPKTPEDIGTLAHEAVHAVRYLFTDIGEESVDEVFAHSVGAIVREALSLKGKK